MYGKKKTFPIQAYRRPMGPSNLFKDPCLWASLDKMCWTFRGNKHDFENIKPIFHCQDNQFLISLSYLKMSVLPWKVLYIFCGNFDTNMFTYYLINHINAPQTNSCNSNNLNIFSCWDLLKLRPNLFIISRVELNWALSTRMYLKLRITMKRP